MDSATLDHAPAARLLASRTIYEGSFLRLVEEEVELPNGAVARLEVMRHPGSAAVVPLLPGGDVALVRQYRHAVGRWLLEVPAGKLDPGESPEACARRELGEETGLPAGELVALGSLWPSPGFTDELIHLFLARVPGAAGPGGQVLVVGEGETAGLDLEPDEVLSVERLPFERAVAMAAGGEIDDGKTACALLRAERLLRSGGGR
jgi:ADP-ribose diphosphatase